MLQAPVVLVLESQSDNPVASVAGQLGGWATKERELGGHHHLLAAGQKLNPCAEISLRKRSIRSGARVLRTFLSLGCDCFVFLVAV